jgi:ubiquinone biosynthesis protein UbiJ
MGRGCMGRFRAKMRGNQASRPLYNRNAAEPANVESHASEIAAFKAQLDTLQQSVDVLNNRIAEMENNQ